MSRGPSTNGPICTLQIACSVQRVTGVVAGHNMPSELLRRGPWVDQDDLEDRVPKYE